MSLNKGFGIRHEEVVINDEDIVIPIAQASPEAPYLENDASWDTTSEFGRIEISEETELQEYDDKCRGIVTDGLQNGKQCTMSYLKTLLQNCILVQLFCEAEVHESPEEIDALVNPVYIELQRLRENPKLFPSQKIAKDFWHRLDNAFTHTVKIRLKYRQHNQAFVDVLAQSFDEEINGMTPLRDMSRKPWEQFLHNNAPGTGKDLRGTAQGGSIQVLPMPALKILSNMKGVQASAIRGIEQARRARGVDIPYSNDKKRDPTLLGVCATTPEGNRRSQLFRTHILDANENGSAYKVRQLAITELETLNEDFAALSGDNAAEHFQVNSSGLVIHDRPV